MTSNPPEKLLAAEDLIFGHTKKGCPPLALGGPLDLSLVPGELVCLLGPNGAGKSTLLRTLSGFLKPLKGSINIQGTALGDYSPRALARTRACLSTREELPAGMSAFDLVALGRHPHSKWTGKLTAADHSAIDAAFNDSGSTAFRTRLMEELSDGERQRVALARLLSQEAPIAFLDEPAAFLDLPSRIEVLGNLARIAKDRRIAILLTTHDLESALRHADRLWLLGHGGKWFQGIPEDLVLSGAFPKVFSSPNLEFNRSSGNFEPEAKIQNGRAIELIGNGVERIWTCRALERSGWNPSDGEEENSELSVIIVNEENQTLWKIQEAGKTDRTARSLQECLQLLPKT